MRIPEQRDKKSGPGAFASEEEECVWMRARVVNFKLCDRLYDCEECPFDKAMQAAWKQENAARETPE